MKLAGQKNVEDIWKPYIRVYKQNGEFGSYQNVERGMYISNSERAKLQDILNNCIRGTILPQTEKKLKVLNSHIQPKKRGLFSKEAASALPVDNKVRAPAFSHSRSKPIGSYVLPPTSLS